MRAKVPPGTRKRLNLIGSVDWVTGEVEAEVLGERWVTAETVATWLEKLATRAQAQAKPIVVVLDRAGIHTAEAIKSKLEGWRRRGLYLGLLPTYSPQLNPMELAWRRLTYSLLPRRAYPDLSSLRSAVELALAHL